MLHVVEYRHFRERVNGRHPVTGGIAEKYTVLHMDASQPTGLQYSHQFGGKVVHLLEELVVKTVVDEHDSFMAFQGG